MSKDWRLEHLETQPELQGVSFARKMYRAYRPGWDHDHCAACWVKLCGSGLEGDEVVHEGYATTADYLHGAEYEWVCVPCFALFGPQMGWIDVTRASSN